MGKMYTYIDGKKCEVKSITPKVDLDNVSKKHLDGGTLDGGGIYGHAVKQNARLMFAAKEEDLPMDVVHGTLGFVAETASSYIFANGAWMRMPNAKEYMELHTDDKEIINRAVEAEKGTKYVCNSIIDRVFSGDYEVK